MDLPTISLTAPGKVTTHPWLGREWASRFFRYLIIRTYRAVGRYINCIPVRQSNLERILISDELCCTHSAGVLISLAIFLRSGRTYRSTTARRCFLILRLRL
jgi:hypothetical protein